MLSLSPVYSGIVGHHIAVHPAYHLSTEEAGVFRVCEPGHLPGVEKVIELCVYVSVLIALIVPEVASAQTVDSNIGHEAGQYTRDCDLVTIGTKELNGIRVQ